MSSGPAGQHPRHPQGNTGHIRCSGRGNGLARGGAIPDRRRSRNRRRIEQGRGQPRPDGRARSHPRSPSGSGGDDLPPARVALAGDPGPRGGAMPPPVDIVPMLWPEGLEAAVGADPDVRLERNRQSACIRLRWFGPSDRVEGRTKDSLDGSGPRSCVRHGVTARGAGRHDRWCGPGRCGFAVEGPRPLIQRCAADKHPGPRLGADTSRTPAGDRSGRHRQPRHPDVGGAAARKPLGCASPPPRIETASSARPSEPRRSGADPADARPTGGVRRAEPPYRARSTQRSTP